MIDVPAGLRATWIWRQGPAVTMVVGLLVLLVSEIRDRRWEASLQKARCTILAAKTEGHIEIYSKNGDDRPGSERARWVEETTVQVRVDGAGPQRRVERKLGGRGLPVGATPECAVAGEDVYLFPEVERLKRRTMAILRSAIVVLCGVLWLVARKQSRTATR